MLNYSVERMVKKMLNQIYCQLLSMVPVLMELLMIQLGVFVPMKMVFSIMEIRIVCCKEINKTTTKTMTKAFKSKRQQTKHEKVLSLLQVKTTEIVSMEMSSFFYLLHVDCRFQGDRGQSVKTKHAKIYLNNNSAKIFCTNLMHNKTRTKIRCTACIQSCQNLTKMKRLRSKQQWERTNKFSH